MDFVTTVFRANSTRVRIFDAVAEINIAHGNWRLRKKCGRV